MSKTHTKVTLYGETFKDVEVIDKPNRHYCGYNDDYCEDCKYCNKLTNKFDCPLYANKVELNYDIFTALSVCTILGYIWFFQSYITTTSIKVFVSIGVVAFFELICSIIERSARERINKRFYKKLLRKKRKKEKIEAKENAKKQKIVKKEQDEKQRKENEFAKENPIYQKVLDAEKLVKDITNLSEECNFEKCQEKLDDCINQLNEIVGILKKDSSGYNRIAFLFEVYLPEFYRLLTKYSDFVSADNVGEEERKTLEVLLERFLEFIEEQKIEAIYDKASSELEFKSSAKVLINQLNKGGRK